MSILAINQICSLVMLLLTHETYFWPIMISVNIYACKAFVFMFYYFSATSNWLLTVISLRRLIGVKYNKFKMFKNKIFKSLVVFAVFALNFSLYTPVIALTYFNTFNSTQSNYSDKNETLITKIKCVPRKNSILYALIFPNIVITIFIPFVIMLFCSIQITVSIIELANRPHSLTHLHSVNEIQFSTSIILLDIVYFLFNLPAVVIYFITDANKYLILAINLFYYGQYFSNLFVYIIFYSRFRRELSDVYF